MIKVKVSSVALRINSIDRDVKPFFASKYLFHTVCGNCLGLDKITVAHSLRQ